MRSYCLYNGNYIDIAEIYEVRDGKQINIPEKLKYYRALSNSRQLFCSCGCGEVVVLVAGDRNLRKQHFRLLHNFANSNCEYQEESDISVKSKIMLKCWLTKNLPIKEHEIKYRVPISQLVENKRRYELSMYSEDYDVGIIYNKHASNIGEEKIDLLSEYLQTKIVYVTRLENEETNGQYPERMMRIQDYQGYCFYLDMTTDSLYEEVKAKVSVFERTHRGLWTILNVCTGTLDEFGLKTDGSLVYKGEPVLDLVDSRKQLFQKEQENELEQIRKREEAERLRQEKILQEQEERKRLEEEKRKQKELEEQREKEEKEHRKEEERKRFLQKYPKFTTVYNLLKEMKSIKGNFDSDQWDGKIKSYNIELTIEAVNINVDKHYIEVFMNNWKKAFIFVLENDFCKVNRPKTGVPYKVLDYIRVDDVERYFRAAFTCVFKESDKEIECIVPEIRCQFLGEKNMCTCEGDCTYQKR